MDPRIFEHLDFLYVICNLKRLFIFNGAVTKSRILVDLTANLRKEMEKREVE